MSSYVLDFQDIGKTKIIAVGGKGADLGELSKVEEIRVPDGFCISTGAFKESSGQRGRLTRSLTTFRRMLGNAPSQVAARRGSTRSVPVRSAETLIEAAKPAIGSKPVIASPKNRKAPATSPDRMAALSRAT